MSIKRFTGNGFTEISSRRRWNGSSWVELTVGKRWNGSGWVDLWSHSTGGSSEGSTPAGMLFSDLKSTVSRPAVHYSCGYGITRSGVSASVELSFKGWLTSSASLLGSGIRLTVFARMNGGEWVPAVIKQSSDVWNDATKHSASLTLNGEDSGRIKIEFYISRAGSGYGGSAGRIASAKSPKGFIL